MLHFLTPRWFALLAFLLLLVGPLMAAEYAGKIVSIGDGDTFALLVLDGASYQQVRVSLAEIDTPEGFAKIETASPGTAARNKAMTEPALMTTEVPILPLAAQKSFDTLQTQVAALKAKHAAIREANAALLPATLERVFSETV